MWNFSLNRFPPASRRKDRRCADAPDGTPEDVKQTYGIAYGIYGLSEHYRATGNKESLETAIRLFRTMEEKVRDKEKDGYIESFTRNWQQPDHIGYDDAAQNATNALRDSVLIIKNKLTVAKTMPSAFVVRLVANTSESAESASIAMKSAFVQLSHATACLAPSIFAKVFSNFSHFGPMEIQLSSTHCLNAAISSLP